MVGTKRSGAEVLILDKQGEVIELSNPFQMLQGQTLFFSPPIELLKLEQLKESGNSQKAGMK